MADHKYQRRAGQQFDEEVSANVLGLIQETEQAFEAVGNAVNDARSVSRLSDSLHLAAPSPNVPRVHSRGPSAPAAERLQPAPPPPKAAEPKPPAKKSGGGLRRAMIEGVGSKLLGQRFKRIVADEMLTPARIEELKKKREQAEAEEEAKLQLACEVPINEQSDKVDTPEEPFHLESFVTHEGAPAVASPSKTAGVNARSVSPGTADADTRRLTPPQHNEHSRGSAEYTTTHDDTATENSSLLSAPSRSPTPSRLSPEPRRLSTIPEIIIDPCPSQEETLDDEPATATVRHDPRRDSDDEFVYLKGTEISFTNRSFRHGPIACHRPEPNQRDAELEVDESVDWTAFHMAIMGGAGDLASGLYEDEQEDMADEMAEWFEGFGFETHGQLVPSRDDSSRSSSQSDTSSSPSTIDLDSDLPIPVHMEHSNLYHAQGRNDGSVDPTAAPFDGIRFFRSSSLRRWRAMEEPAYWAPTIRRDSGRKPMKRPDPLVVGSEDYGYGDVSESVVDMAPMGCNLENDLGDYLRWGSQHVGAPL
ncbi:hypothetical protein JDV02_009042 [Purpureocillium takamizusanense]|uniref:Uncharacterized protein n=1 Tax=Purpureocillium takamizusanense TaxID=2060973 RepID=A0A9Q8VDV8_9HYPO|nr:uncharacterized protein JDV02_009042 [Purpureocillium takamizusanense]UNI23210.1 hypothetical protein JDV02_009042 [Purpureocillium takamizusanense]